jgi:putative spermidine/putrescine transport system substrate-binding protein
MSTQMNKRRIAAIAASFVVVASLAACAPTSSTSSTSSGAATKMNIACYAGTYADMFKKDIFPAFEKAHNVTFNYTSGISTETIAKLQAGKSNPTLDLACIDTGPKSTANGLGLLATNDKAEMPNLSHLEKYAVDPDNMGVIWGTLGLGIAYDKTALAKAGIKPPTSWNDLADSRFKNQVVMSSINTTYGVLSLVQWAKANGGSVKDIDPGFTEAAKVKQNAVAVSEQADLSTYFEQGEASVGIWTDAETKGFATSSKFSMGFVYPTDGAPIIGATMAAVKGSKHAKLAQEFLNYLISPKVQAIIAKEAGFRPVVDNVKLSAAVKSSIDYDSAGHLVQPDYAGINKNRAAWTTRWLKEIG